MKTWVGFTSLSADARESGCRRLAVTGSMPGEERGFRASPKTFQSPCLAKWEAKFNPTIPVAPAINALWFAMYLLEGKIVPFPYDASHAHWFRREAHESIEFPAPVPSYFRVAPR